MPKNDGIIKPDGVEVNDAIAQARFARDCRRVFLLFLIAVALLHVACGGREGRAQKLYDQAMQHVEQAEFDEAARVFQEIIDRYPGTDVARQAQAEILLYRGLSTAVDTYPVRTVRDQMITTARAVYRYEDRRRRWPKSLSELTPKYLADSPIDPWGRELIYVVKGRRSGYVLGCYGSDGQPGGEGEARDWFIENGRFVRQPSVELP